MLRSHDQGGQTSSCLCCVDSSKELEVAVEEDSVHVQVPGDAVHVPHEPRASRHSEDHQNHLKNFNYQLLGLCQCVRHGAGSLQDFIAGFFTMVGFLVLSYILNKQDYHVRFLVLFLNFFC